MSRVLPALCLTAVLLAVGASSATSASVPPESTPEIEIGMAPQEITVGDPVVVELSLAAPAGSEAPVFPDWSSGSWGRVEILDIGETRQLPAGPGLSRHTQRLVVTAFEVGEIELPPIAVELPRADGESRFARSETRLLRVVSVLPAGDDSEATREPRPPAPLRELPVGPAFWWTLGLLSLAAGLLATWLLRINPEIEIVRPRLSPLDEFDRLVRDLGREADPVAFHTRLSFALRHFLGRTLGFGAIESTTTEIQRRLREHHLAGETVRHTSQMLRDCDQVKFAHILAGQRGAEETLGEAGRLARSVYRDMQPDDAEAVEGSRS